MPTFTPDTVVLVTGSSRGLGLEIVKQLLENTRSKVVATARNPANSAGLSALAKEFAGRVHLVVLDTSDDASIQEAATSVSKLHKGIDILINNAGIDEGVGPVSDLSGATYRNILNVNVVGTFLVTMAFLPLLRIKDTRTIINVSSTLGSIKTNREAFETKPHLANKLLAYNSSKSAVNMQTSVLANDLKTENFSVLAVNPGWVETDMGGKNAREMGFERAPLDVHQSITMVLKVIRDMTPEKSGQYLDEEGKPIPY